MSQTHDLKCWPHYFKVILDGDKPFELRRNDRDFHAGDRVRLREYVPPEPGIAEGYYTGREITADVPYVLFRAEGLAEGFALLTIVPHLDAAMPARGAAMPEPGERA